ncbi:MAG: hypothetical protein HY831_04085 [Candidatus Aenigmarchaeota archaeon]|nr:hypothetical protein [Candidatus Aenigmarchaeota archaeon]
MLDHLSERERAIYWWNYGEIGQNLVENSVHIKSLLKIGYKIMDGHNFVEKRFFNLKVLEHLDIVIYDSSHNLVKAICEVKTTKNKNKKEFEANGSCEYIMKLAKKNKISLFFAVVRLADLLPLDIISRKGFDKTLEKLKNDNSFYKIEFYKEGEFELSGGIFRIN